MNAPLRVRMLPAFPSRIRGQDGVKVTRVDGSTEQVVSLDFENLGDISGIPDPSQNFFAMYDAESGTYVRIRFQDMFDASGVSSGYPTISAAELANIPAPVHAIYVFGDAAVGDGLGGLYIDSNNGSGNTFVSGDGRTWYRVKDVASDRLKDAGAAGVSILAMAAVADVRNFLDTAPYIATRTALKALDTTKDLVAILTEAGREGIFIWKSGNYSTQVAADTLEGIFLKADAIATTAGAWERLHDEVDVRWFGAVGDGSDATAAFAAAISLSQTLGYYRIVCKDSTKQFKIIELQITARIEIDLYGGTILGDFGAWGTHATLGTPIYWTKNVFNSVAANAPSVTLKNMILNGQSTPTVAMIGGTPIIDFRGAASPGRCVIRFENFTFTRGSNRIYTAGSGISPPTLALDYRGMEILIYNADEFWGRHVEMRSSPGEMLQIQSDDKRTKVRIDDIYATKARDNDGARWSNSAVNIMNCHPTSELRNGRFWLFIKTPVNWESDGGLVETTEFVDVNDSNGLDFNEAASYRFNQFAVKNCFFKDIVNVGLRASSSNTLFENNTFEGVDICISFDGDVAGDPAKGTWLKTDDAILANNIVRNCWFKSFNPAHVNRIGVRARGASAALPIALLVEGGSIVDRQPAGNKALYGVYGQNVNLSLRGYFGDGTTGLFFLTGTCKVRGRDVIVAPEPGETVSTFVMTTLTLGKKSFVFDNITRTTTLDGGQFDFLVTTPTFDIDAVHINGSPDFAATASTTVATSRDGRLSGSATFDPGSIANGASLTTTVTVSGARLGDRAEAFLNTSQMGLSVVAYVNASNSVTVIYTNNTGAAVDLTSHTVTAWVAKPLS